MSEEAPKDNKDEAAGSPDEHKAEGGGGSKKKIIIGAVVAIIVVVALVFVMKGKKSEEPDESHDAHKKEESHEKKSDDGHGKKKDSNDHGSPPAHGEESSGGPQVNLPGLHGVYYDIPDFVVNITSSNNKMMYLKLSLTVKLEKSSDATLLLPNLPLIRDNLQIYLRTLKESDLQGSEALYILKDELLKRINNLSSPVEAQDVLIRDIILN